MEKIMKTCLKNEHLRKATSFSVQGTASRPVLSHKESGKSVVEKVEKKGGQIVQSFRGHCGYLKISILEIFCPAI